jgi:hypothetical protein
MFVSMYARVHMRVGVCAHVSLPIVHDLAGLFLLCEANRTKQAILMWMGPARMGWCFTEPESRFADAVYTSQAEALAVTAVHAYTIHSTITAATCMRTHAHTYTCTHFTYSCRLPSCASIRTARCWLGTSSSFPLSSCIPAKPLSLQV